MKKITLLHIAQVLVFFILLSVQKNNGYTWSIMLGQPSLYFYFIFPASLASGVFGLFFAFTSKEMNLYEKLAFASITIILSIVIGTSPWIYIQVGSSLQVLIYTLSPFFVAIEIIYFQLLKSFLQKKKNK